MAEGGGEQEGGGEAPSLAGHFHRCTARASRRSAARRAHALSRLGLPDGRRVEFGKGARRGIPPEVLEDIRRRSPMDAELYDLALQLLDDSRSRAAEAGTLLRLPDAPPQKPPPLQQHQRGGGGATGQGQGGEAERPRRRRPARQQQEGGAPPVRDELRR
ncbi:hypothetical protein Rsub_08960 [Raphidocelis subcapitata]|uniref:Uncharacterized protein n=1 Tax=Raphidocelis subcapitata TaxID=307507 RepID=A0A2V0P891_9CHLO|nr:hypothetical protein Rsub_08960 [Raphidocelis subcapitata]|eukprot:GBF96084.1 hypothetical protein Rsub_08960 [Raphidocelis subcapitata]